MPTPTPTPSIRIRPVADHDFQSIADLTNHYILHTTIHFGTDPTTAQDHRSACHNAKLPNGSLYPFLVAEFTTAPPNAPSFAGYAKAYRWRERAAYAATAETGIYIAQSAQGTGIGPLLYEALFTACRNAGLHALIGVIALPNDPSIKLHERTGFTLQGTFPQVGHKFNAFHDVAFYQKML